MASRTWSSTAIAWLAATPRAHITNQRTMEVLRDLGREVEAEAYMHATEQDLMGENVFCTSLAGEEIGRMRSWGKHPLSRAEHLLSSPSHMNDLPQTFMEPLLFKTGLFARHAIAHVDGISVAHPGRRRRHHHLSRPADWQGHHHPLEYLVGADGAILWSPNMPACPSRARWASAAR